MKIEKLICSNFRNYKEFDIDFCDGVNLITAPNGSGKSNLLEALYYLSYVRPFRQVNDIDLIKKSENQFSIGCEYSKKGIQSNIEINYNKKEKLIKIDNKKITKHSEVLGKLLTVLFSSDDIFIINGSQSIRRRFFNMFFSVIDHMYLDNLRKYEKLLKQKNVLLRTGKKELLPFFDEQLADSVYYIQSKRIELIERINVVYSESFKEIGFFSDKVSLKYSPSIKIDDLSKEGILEKIIKARKTDIDRGFATNGSHKDEYLFFINNIIFSKYGSFGQLRLASLLIKYVQSFFYKEKFGIDPIYLLDDVILELDSRRQKSFIDFLDYDNQLFITVTDRKYAEIFSNKKTLKLIEVKDGKIL